MFYEPKNGHDLPENPLNALVIPRPIGWISTLNSEGVPNLAPYSFFNAVAYTPPQVMFAATGCHMFGGSKDAVADAESTGEFVVNIATLELAEQMNASSVPAPHNTDEFEYSGLTKANSKVVKCPAVAESPVHLECRQTQSVSMLSNNANSPNIVVFGEVVGVHIDDGVIVDGRINFLKLGVIGRLGYLDFVAVNNVFSMNRPDWDPK
jgi:flavin reductase (DIM6/NTAB) family NADH-FMN oxidoreductase RutF